VKNKFDSIKVGQKAEITHLITQLDVDKFIDLTGDDNKLHVDEEYASKTAFKKPVVHGMLGAGFISALIGTKLPGDGALWFAQNLEFLLPVRVGDTITAKAEVTKKIKRMQTIEMTTEIYNQNNQLVTKGTAKVKIVEEEKSTPQKDTQKSKKPVALVVGGTGGIGRSACLQLAQDGFDVAIHYHQNKKLAGKIKDQILASGKKAICVGADITDYDQVQHMISSIVRRFENITVLVNCATVPIPNITFANLQWRNITQQLEINLKGSFNILKCLIPLMEQSNYGKIINTITHYVDAPKPELLHYITAKSALHGFTKALAAELAPKGIRINSISPGMTDTDLLANVPEKVKLLTAAQTPLRTIAKPDDVVGAISYLASHKSDYLTGETIRVNGGQIMI
jgi:3-oxoacyl-[acyl-carrier protein] reductase